MRPQTLPKIMLSFDLVKFLETLCCRMSCTRPKFYDTDLCSGYIEITVFCSKPSAVYLNDQQ